MADIYNCHLLIPDAFPRTRPGQFDHEPWMQSKLGFLEKKRETWSAITEDLKQDLKQLQDQSDPDTEEIDILHNEVQSMLALLENNDTEIKLEKKKLRKIAKVSKQQEKKLRQIAKSGKQIAKSGKQTTKVPKQQKKVFD